MKVKILSFEEILEKRNALSEHIDLMSFTKGFYDAKQDLIAIKNNETKLIEIIMHELVHATGSKNRLNRKTVSSADDKDWFKKSFKAKTKAYHTEEATAQMGMYKLAKYLKLDSKKYKRARDNYLKKYKFADLKKAERQSEKAFLFLKNLLNKK